MEWIPNWFWLGLSVIGFIALIISILIFISGWQPSENEDIKDAQMRLMELREDTNKFHKEYPDIDPQNASGLEVIRKRRY